MTFGRYRLLSVIGRGGMGNVYKARDTVIPRDVAIKVLSNDLGADPDYQERFRREALAAGRLNEPHIISIYDTGEIDGRLYLVMPVVEGVDLDELLRRDGPMRPQRAVRMVEQLADALHAAHSAGLVHRDVKPSNALVTANDHVYLIDFGIAHDAAAPKITRTGEMFGSFGYMAPERFDIDAGPPDASADIYALACVFYECLTASQPYPGTPQQQYSGHVNLDPPKPTRLVSIPAEFDEVIARGMAKDPRERYASAYDLSAAAQRALRGRSNEAKVVIDPIRSAAPPTRHHNRVPPAPPSTRQHMQTTPPAPFHARPDAAAPAQRSRQRRRLSGPLIAGIVVLVVVVLGITSYLLQPNSNSPASQAPAPQAPQGPGAAGQSANPSGRQPALPFTGLNRPGGIAVDGAGDVYVTDGGNDRVLELTTGASAPTELPFAGLGNPTGVAVDTARTVYVTNVGNNRILKLAAGSTSTVELPITGLNGPQAVAVDNAGNLYIAAGNRVLKLPAGSSNTVDLAFTGLNGATGVAVDNAGGVYVTDSGNNRVLKLTAGSAQSLPFTGLNKPDGVAVDTGSNVYVVDSGNNRVLKLPANASAPTALSSNNFKNPGGVAVDAAGNVYVADTGNNRVVKLAAG
ncbi:hypothetical protein AWC05_00760 [Mycobacterium florentinum]|uniref:non-specific serine/threonine protein kinase n=1 Tax=Mycobacterium florentinum TaxID=292462 RepID=A0A1X1TYN0_MYCFL|nr:serine/threonine-protein kinase PknD [Mycobacterium florentinum]MCV7409230.1 protein kinase [Mycobacterium florentinum]ORV49686.1 hypothetical protein AWC05_00760 [Mycobacterium florentinum]